MKGKILDYNIQDSIGIISAENGERYNFSTTQWKSSDYPGVDQIVDFQIDGENALDIYLDYSEIDSSKSKIAAALLALFLGGFGIHKFYLGCTKAGIIMLLVFILGFILLGIPSLVIGLIAFIEAIIYLTKSDKDFEKLYVKNTKCWF